MIDIDEAAAVELARHVRTTNAQVAGQHRVALREHTGVLAALGGGYRGDGHTSRVRPPGRRSLTPTGPGSASFRTLSGASPDRCAATAAS